MKLCRILHFLPFLLALLLSVPAPRARAAGFYGQCLGKIRMALDEKVHEMEDIRILANRVQLSQVLPETEESDSVALGVMPIGHAYLMSGTDRFNAVPLQGAKILTTGAANDGFLMKLDLSPEKRRALSDAFKNTPRANRTEWSCIHGACRILREGAGVEVQGRPEGNSFSASQLFTEIMEKGFVDSKTKEPIKMTIYRLSERELKDVRAGLQDQQMHYIAKYATLAAFVGTASFVVFEIAKKHIIRLKQNLSAPSPLEGADQTADEKMCFDDLEHQLQGFAFDEDISKWLRTRREANELAEPEFQKSLEFVKNRRKVPHNEVLIQFLHFELQKARKEHPNWTYEDFEKSINTRYYR